MKLLTREQFQEQVFKRDRFTCIFCDRVAVDAHHILDRKLWSDGGYYLSNGASVCGQHHWQCEITELSVETVRQAAKITELALPPGFSSELTYDKWGNVLRDGMIEKGPLFSDTGCYKALMHGKKLGFVIYT